MRWISKKFSQLTTDELYDLLKLRVDIFVVEQTCYYPELDDKDRDPQAWHLMGFDGDTLVAYVRALPPGVSYPEYPSIGRVAIAESARGNSLGHDLMTQAVALCQQHWPDQAIKISAQEHLQRYYQRHGFETVSAPYLEDDIPHVAMLRA